MVPFSLKSAIFLMTSSGLFQLATAAVIYADFVLTPGGSLPLAASLGGLSELSEVTKAQCQYACSVDAACLAYQHSTFY